MNLQLPDGWTLKEDQYGNDGVFARCSFKDKTITITVPWYLRPLKRWILLHELGHANGIPQDCSDKTCIMYGTPGNDGWHEKVSVLARLWGRVKRGDWFCKRCRNCLRAYKKFGV